MDATDMNLPPKARQHQEVMRRILLAMQDFEAPLVLKGGTALRFDYHLPRLSEDLDFGTSLIPEIPEIVRRVSSALDGFAEVLDTLHEVVQMNDKGAPGLVFLAINYKGAIGERTLLIDFMYHKSITPEQWQMSKGGYRVFVLERLIAQKIRAACNLTDRHKARDYFDLDFCASQYPHHFTGQSIATILERMSDADYVFDKLRPFLHNDHLIQEVGLDGPIALRKLLDSLHGKLLSLKEQWLKDNPGSPLPKPLGHAVPEKLDRQK